MEALDNNPEQHEQRRQEQREQQRQQPEQTQPEQTQPEQQQEQPQQQEEPQEPGRPPRRRGRTTLIVASAALLGIVGGGAIGYTIQADRPPTPLPALSQHAPAYPAKPLPEGKGRPPLTTAEDRGLATDGDLRKQLVPRPRGARTADRQLYARGGLPVDGWITPSAFASIRTDVASGFTELTEKNVRRIAADDWVQGQDREGVVRLVQYRAGSGTAAREMADGQLRYLPEGGDEGERGGSVEGSGNARYVVRSPASVAVDGHGYWATALGWRGDVVFIIDLFDTRPISEKDIRTLAERQLERL
ncbi:hypothetical protein [Streptomyces sp. NPDC059398]|uniref:hypothetical protein n=1 Tax=Streptomyces sp. NPDC059398 TaxID=3346820 RepID=UPI0036A5AB8A